MRTYLRRRGRLTRGQQRALAAHGDEAVITAGTRGPIDWPARFSRNAPLGVEIGFGMGHALLEWAEVSPEWNLLGVEVYQPGIGAVLRGREERQLEHLLVVEDEANQALQTMFKPATIDEIRLFFPDPRPKKRHQKRRLIQPAFVSLLASRLVAGGIFRLATDWEPYADWMLEILQAEVMLFNDHGSGFAPRPQSRPVTRFEARGRRLGHGLWDLCYHKI